jgi:polysaccharide export outer membrane protein
MTSYRRVSTILLLACAAGIAGCAAAVPQAGRVPGDLTAPVARELDKVSLPRYVIEPPDILLIDALRVVPKSPFRIEPLDILYLQVAGTPVDSPIEGPYAVEPGGAVDLGALYGKVNVAGLSLDEASDAVTLHLRRILSNPQVSLTLYQSAGQQQIVGEHIVGMDGKIVLGVYGTVFVAGMTVDEAKEAIQRHLSQFLEETSISVDVLAYNSKVYYVITEGAGFGDNIQRFAVTGNETVLDAISQVNGLSRLSSKNIWIARPAPAGDCFQILPVRWDDVARNAGTMTNYQVLPGDRIFVEESHLVAADSFLAKLTSPIERVLGFSLLGANTIQTYQRFPGGFNQF